MAISQAKPYIYPMQKITLLALVCISLLPISVHCQDTLWYDISWRKATADNAAFYRIRIKTDTGCLIVDHYRSGKVQMTGGYADDSFSIKQGEFRWYNEDGRVSHLSTYRKGKLEGLEVLYYEDGREKLKGPNKDGDRDSQWVVYFPSGKVAGHATYQAGNRVSMSLFHEDGSKNTKDTIFQRDAEFPGGTPQFLRFMNKSLRYPDSAVVYEIQGTVMVKFKVSKAGKMTDFTVTQSADKYLDEEALRVLRKMPDWNPAIVAGVPIDSYFYQPVAFSLQGQ